MKKTKKKILRTDILVGLTKDKKLINNSASPDELLSVISYLMSHAANTVSEYILKYNDDGKYDKLTKNDLLHKMMSAAQMYDLIEAGYTADEAGKIVGIPGAVSHEIPED